MFVKLKFPANAMFLTQAMIQIAQFDLVETGDLDNHIYTLPRQKSYNLGFEQCGYESLLFLVNSSVLVWMIYMHFVILVLVYGPVWLIHRKSGKLAGAKHKLESYFFWNGPIRFLMEISFELILTAMLNVQTADWQTAFHSVRYSTALAVISLTLVAIIFPFLSVLYYRNMAILSKKSFKEKYIAGIEGTKYETSGTPPKSIVAYPTIFVVRRFLFSVSVIYMNDNIVAQLSLQILISILIFAYLW